MEFGIFSSDSCRHTTAARTYDEKDDDQRPFVREVAPKLRGLTSVGGPTVVQA
ncbi:MAG: hypothetical protein IT537_26535 [Hyphomicrobiales bacterium]|nr:hypothetical protein [Hyphomicrobiales bacterium]